MRCHPPSPELRELVDRLLDGGGLDRIESARLETLITDDPQALDYYLSMTTQAAQLARVLAGRHQAKQTTARPFIRRLQPLATIFFSDYPLLKAAAMLVLLTCGIGIGWLLFSADDKIVVATTSTSLDEADAERKPPAATITGLLGVEWEDTDAGWSLDRRHPERLRMRSGLAELTFASGVRVTLEGPADFTVTSDLSATLDAGKLVAYVPPSGQGFSIDYAGGRVVDLGTEFAMSTGLNRTTKVGVYDGLVELHRPDKPILRVSTDEAIELSSDHGLNAASVPFDRQRFVRSIPSRDFAWELRDLGPQEFVFDVSHLVWKAGNYRAIFKWMLGRDGVQIRDVTLSRDGVPVAMVAQTGSTGALDNVENNLFELPLSRDQARRGLWEIRCTLEPLDRTGASFDPSMPVESIGMMLFEEGLVANATAGDFAGTWSYRHEGRNFQRTFHPDGAITLRIDGEISRGPLGTRRWAVEQGILRIPIPDSRNPSQMLYEEHVLRDHDTLIFVSNPYGNAKREP